MFDHVGIVVANLDVARAFYGGCLAALHYHLLQDLAQTPTEGRLVFGRGGRGDPFFVVAAGRPSYWNTVHRTGSAPDHLAFVAPNREAVDAFHRAGLQNGGRDNGAPGPRRSSTEYYAAFLVDPDGNNVEAGFRS